MACWWRGPSPRWAASESPSPGPILIQPHVPSSSGLDCSNNSPLSQAWIMQTLSNLNIKWIKGGRSYQLSRKLQAEREISLKPFNVFINTDASIMLKIWISFKTVMAAYWNYAKSSPTLPLLLISPGCLQAEVQIWRPLQVAIESISPKVRSKIKKFWLGFTKISYVTQTT